MIGAIRAVQNDLDLLYRKSKSYVWGNSNLSDVLNQPLSLAYCSLIFIKQGSADINILFKNYHLKSGDFLFLSEDSLAILQKRSTDFSCDYCIFNRDFAAEVASVLPNSLFTYLHLFPHFSPEMSYQSLIKTWINQTTFILQSTSEYQRILLCNHLQNFFLVLSETVNREKLLSKNEYSRKEKLCWQFWEMTSLHCKNHRDVNFYAKALNITPYYLSKLSKQFFNDNAKTLIDRQVILKLKELLRTPSNSIQSIADQLNFEDTSYMCRYFKKHTGFTLLQYRKSA